MNAAPEFEDRERRLDALRERAQTAPPSARGYYGHGVVRPPVWTWEVPLYFFVGGTAGMSSVIAACAIATHSSLMLTRAALWLAAGGALVSPLLLVSDLGRPRRFLNMLRVFKLRSPMSVGVWTLMVFGFFSMSSALCFESFRWVEWVSPRTLADLLFAFALAAAASGALLASYTGVLLGATAVPAWNRHRVLLPFHFVTAALGSAAGALELLGFSEHALGVLGLGAASLETLFFAWLELRRRGVADRALHRGAPAALLRVSGALAGPLAFAVRAMGGARAAAAFFVVGALISRFAWIAAGRASALDPEASLTAPARET
jgi:Polysulphide reductase, NrfD